MADILQVAERLSKINVEQVLIKILSRPKTQEFIIELNTQVQLYNEGENSLGVKLSAVGGSYTRRTREIKKAKGQPTNRVTLYDTGEFYDSFTVKPTASADFIINSDPIKIDERTGQVTNLFFRWGKDVEGLNPENMEKVLKYLENEFFKEVLY